jgi:hypothetical protein
MVVQVMCKERILRRSVRRMRKSVPIRGAQQATYYYLLGRSVKFN